MGRRAQTVPTRPRRRLAPSRQVRHVPSKAAAIDRALDATGLYVTGDLISS